MRNIVLIHGALGDASQMKNFSIFFQSTYRIHTINLPGHGVDSGNATAFNMQQMVDAVAEEIRNKKMKEVVVFGFSMGGYIGMCLAKQYPKLINALITIGTKYEWSDEIAQAQSGFFDTNKIEAKQPAFATHLSIVHGENWKMVVMQTGKMIEALGHTPLLLDTDYKDILCPTLIMLGDRDRMVGINETMNVFKQLPHGSLCILPKSQHAFEQLNQALVYHVVDSYLQNLC